MTRTDDGGRTPLGGRARAMVALARADGFGGGPVDAVAAAIDDIPGHRILTPDPALWRDAGLPAGLLARLQGRPREDRCRTLNDAPVLVLARRHGIAVLTRNLAGFDPLQPIVPEAKVLV